MTLSTIGYYGEKYVKFACCALGHGIYLDIFIFMAQTSDGLLAKSAGWQQLMTRIARKRAVTRGTKMTRDGTGRSR